MYIEKQQDIRDCGLYLIQAFHRKYFNKRISINQLKISVTYGSNGISIKNLIRLSSEYGLTMDPYNATITEIENKIGSAEFITIIKNDNENHYVAAQIRSNYVYISDSVNGNYSVQLKEFINMYQGIVIFVSKGEIKSEYKKETKPWSIIRENKILVFWLMITITLSIIFVFTSTLFTKILLDKIIPGGLESTLVVLSLGFGWLLLLRVLNGVFHSFLMKKLSLQIEWKLTDMYFYKIRNGKIKQLSKLTTNDHIRRLNLIGQVSSFISNVYFSIFSEVITIIVSVTLLIWIDIELFAITMAATFLVVLISLITQWIVRDQYDEAINLNLKYYDSMIENIHFISEHKSLRVKNSLIHKQINSYKNTKHKEFSIWSSQTLREVFNHIVEAVAPILLMYFATIKIFENKMSVGSMMMFVALFHNFIDPTIRMTSLIIKVPYSRKNMELITFILSIPDEDKNPKGLKLKDISKISFDKFKFSYSKELLNIKSFEINRNTHINGKNGSGKSTLLNVISGKYGLVNGITINGIALKQYSLNSYRNKVYLASNTSFLREESVIESITEGDRKAVEKFKDAIIKYNLTQLLSDLNLSLNSMILSNGSNLSAGQKQLIKILKLFAFSYELIILDEALENIDEQKIKWLSKALKESQDALYIEVSHSSKYLSKGKKVNIEEIT